MGKLLDKLRGFHAPSPSPSAQALGPQPERDLMRNLTERRSAVAGLAPTVAPAPATINRFQGENPAAPFMPSSPSPAPLLPREQVFGTKPALPPAAPMVPHQQLHNRPTAPATYSVEFAQPPIWKPPVFKMAEPAPAPRPALATNPLSSELSATVASQPVVLDKSEDQQYVDQIPALTSAQPVQASIQTHPPADTAHSFVEWATTANVAPGPTSSPVAQAESRQLPPAEIVSDETIIISTQPPSPAMPPLAVVEPSAMAEPLVAAQAMPIDPITPPPSLVHDVVPETRSPVPSPLPPVNPATIEPRVTRAEERPLPAPPQRLRESRSAAMVTHENAEETKRTVISNSTVLENTRMTSPGHEVALYGSISGFVDCESFVVKAGGTYTGRVIATDRVEIHGRVHDAKITAHTVLIMETAEVSGNTIIVGREIGTQKGAKINARLIADGALDNDERVIFVDNPAAYLGAGPAIDAD